MTDRACRHGHHECQQCDAPVRFDRLGLPYYWSPTVVVSRVEINEVEYQDPPGVVRSDN